MSKIQNPKTKKTFAKKSFGQNFLVDENYVGKIISALDPQAGETIIEIGAGRGALTEKLLNANANVAAIELERDMIVVLQDKFKTHANFRLIESDALKVDFAEISSFTNQASRIKLVANLPYYISTAILQKLIAEREVFSEMILMFQREVVERITARAGSSERGFLTVLTENYLETEKLFDVPPNAFCPVPKVWSAVARLKPKENVEIADDRFFRELIGAAFGQKRKTIFNNLKAKFPRQDVKKILAACSIDASRRSESLDFGEWQVLSNKFAQEIV